MKKPHALLAGKVIVAVAALQSIAWGTPPRDTVLSECMAVTPKGFQYPSAPDLEGSAGALDGAPFLTSQSDRAFIIRSTVKSEDEIRLRLVMLGLVDDEDNMFCQHDTYTLNVASFADEESHLTCLIQLPSSVDPTVIQPSDPELERIDAEVTRDLSAFGSYVQLDSWSVLPKTVFTAGQALAQKHGGKLLGCTLDAGIKI